jgi:ferric-dicitrate binding protein FerR (iron transport regulator)
MKRSINDHHATHADNPVAAELGELVRNAIPATNGFDSEFVADTVALARQDLEARRSTGLRRTATGIDAAARLSRAPSAIPLRYAVAAAVTLLAVVAAALYFPGRFDTQPGQQPVRMVNLPDGSSVMLAVGAQVVASPDFPRTRRVSLTGEAFFDVARGDDEFIVEVEEGQIVVKGTRFNVRSWPDALTYAEIALIEGSVEVRPQDGTPLVVKPGQYVRFGVDESAIPATAELDNLLAWQTGGFSFRHEPAAFVFEEVARRYDAKIVLANDLDESRRLTYLSPQPATLNEVLSDLCHALNLRFSAIQGGYEIH